MTMLKVDADGRIKLPKKLLKALGPDGRIELRDSIPGHIELVVPPPRSTQTARRANAPTPVASTAAESTAATVTSDDARRQIDAFMESMRAFHPKDMPKFPGDTLQTAIDEACHQRAEQIVRNGRG